MRVWGMKTEVEINRKIDALMEQIRQAQKEGYASTSTMVIAIRESARMLYWVVGP